MSTNQTTLSINTYSATPQYGLSVAMATVHEVLPYGEVVFGVHNNKDFRLRYGYSLKADTEDSTPCLLHSVPEISLPVVALRVKAHRLAKSASIDEDSLYISLTSEYLLMALAYLEEIKMFGKACVEEDLDSMKSMRAFQVRVVMKQLGLSC